MSKPEVLAIIPARGGSKGIPRKNLVELDGKPLIAHSIEAARRARLVTRVIVSTEDEEIAEVSRQWGGEVPFLRPPHLAGDRASVDDAVRFTLEELRRMRYVPTVTIILFPTSPFRPPGLIDFLTNKALAGYSPVQTITPTIATGLSYFVDAGKRRQNVFPLQPLAPSLGTRRFGRPNGLFLASSDRGCRPYIFSVLDPVLEVDIDTPADLDLAREIVRFGLFDPCGWEACLH